MLLCVSASHKKTSFTVLEQLACIGPDFASALTGVKGIDGVAVLSTCSRFEVYCDTQYHPEPHTIQKAGYDTGHPGATDQWRAVYNTGLIVQKRMGERCNISPSTILEQTSFLAGSDVPKHLFSVTSGLESVIVGETEIAGQVKRALTYAREHKTISSELERLFQRASAVSRRVREASAINKVGQSLVGLALDLASNRIGDWSSVKAMIIGSGRYASKALALLKERGVVEIGLHSPSGQGISDAQHVKNVNNLEEGLVDCDLVIGCSAVDKPVITKLDIERARTKGKKILRPRPVVCPITGRVAITNSTRPRYVLIDLGLPRNFEPSIANLEDIDLIDLDTLRIHAPFDNLVAETTARRIVNKDSNRFLKDCKQYEAGPTIESFRLYLENMAQEALYKHGACDHSQLALRSFINSMLHIPLTRCRKFAERGEMHKFIEALETVFAFDWESNSRNSADKTLPLQKNNPID